MSCFHTAATTLVREDHKYESEKSQPSTLYPDAPRIGGGMSREEWVRAVVKGADERSQRWRHIILLGGLLVGFEQQDQQGLPGSLRRTLEGALVQATNLALIEARHGDELAGQTICLVLNHSFPLLSDADRAKLDYDHLLPVLIGTSYFSSEGFQSAYFLGSIAVDTKEAAGGILSWSSSSQSARQVDRVLSRPLVSSMGPLSRLVAHTAENVKGSWLIQTMVDDLTGFTRALVNQWRQLKLSEIDVAEESTRLDDETRNKSLAALWKLLRSTLFATVIILRGVIGRLLNDSMLSSNAIAPVLATQTLQCLRNLYFISTRTGTDSFSQYTFIYLTSIDILSAYPSQSSEFLQSIAPVSLGQIPSHSLDRSLDLYFLNTAEHFALILSPQLNEDLLVTAATPYLAAGGNNHLLPIFEAAHSVMLSVLSAPQSADLAAKHLPFYIDALFRVFPNNLSPRQFRLAFKTLMRVSAPPSAISGSQPDLSGTLMELVHHRALTALDVPLKPAQVPSADAEADDAALLSEKAVLVITFLDALPYLPLDLLEDSLPMAAEMLHGIPDPGMRRQCQERFWDVLVNGEMDPERSQICVVWWGTQGGREMVVRQAGVNQDGEPFMSGALPPNESKL